MLDAGTALISMRDPEGNGPGHLDILETELGRAYCRWTFNVTTQADIDDIRMDIGDIAAKVIRRRAPQPNLVAGPSVMAGER
jgi:hypothetical protein